MDNDRVIEHLARAAHALWCDNMKGDGWRYGPVYDEQARTHDALVAFDDLAQADRDEAVQSAAASGAAEILAETLRYDRGDDRPFTPDELRIGAAVGWAPGAEFPPSGGHHADERGAVVG